MDGALFYWVAWISWVISTFFMKKTKLRLNVSACMLILLILTAHSFTIENLTINIGLLFLLLVGYVIILPKSVFKLLYFYLTTLIITLLYVSFHIFSLIDPIWLLFDAKWMLAIGLVYFVIILQTKIKDRVFVLILGTCHGEILYGLIIGQYHFPIHIGSIVFFDFLSVCFILIQSWYSFETISRNFESYIQKNFKEKSKHGNI